ncbi:MAG: HAD-IIIA family hydrolase [Chitinophagaceae bacterium]|nr:HAD-IIIA family hydrolase [Chitinophagaceae bacterium]
MFDLKTIDNSWTLFLDRDGVINFERNNDYVKAWDEFKFYDESIKALPLLAAKFTTIVITTNQKGVGRGIMTEESLQTIHHNMVSEIEKVGGRIDHIFYCIDVDNDSINRKPQPGMALQAKEQFTSIDFTKSIMVGNRTSDMEFGRNAGLHTVFLATTHPDTAYPNALIDYRFNHLLEFAKAL